ncbi:MAG: glycosyltransferase family 39 protein [Planctomycetota bacterium]
MRDRWKRAGCVLAIVVFAFALRAVGSAGRGYPFSFYPDETANLNRAVKIYSPESPLKVDLNLHWFNKPSLGFYLNFLEFGGLYGWGRYVSGVYEGPGDFARSFFNDRGPFYLVARLFNAFWAALTVWLVWRIGTRAFDRATGYLAAGLLAITPGHVLWSQMVKHDILAGFFAAASFLWILKILDCGRWRDYLFAGFCAGLGAATKYSPVVMGLPLVFAHLLRARPEGAPVGRAAFARLAGGLAAILGGFFAGSPYNFLDGKWLHDNVLPQLRLARGLVFGAGEVNAENDSFWTQLARFWNVLDNNEALGMVLILLALVGAVTGLRGATRTVTGLILAALGGFTFVFCAMNQQYPRENHLVPMYPFAAVLAARGALWCFAQLRDDHRASRRSIAILLLALLVPLPGFPGRGLWTIQADAMRVHPQLAAWHWIQAEIPAGAMVLNDHEVVHLGLTDERLTWIRERIDRELERNRAALASIADGDDRAEDRRRYHRERIERYESYASQYRFITEAAPKYAHRRYDSIILLKPWQEDDREKFESKAYGYNDLWHVLPLGVPEDVAPIERYRIPRSTLPESVQGEDRAGFPILERPAEYLVTRRESFDNYEKPHRRRWWPEWAAFYDDLKAHYDCWEFPETGTEQGLGTVRVYDLRQRVEDREPKIEVVDLDAWRRLRGE